jgi:hypothetical protein
MPAAVVPVPMPLSAPAPASVSTGVSISAFVPASASAAASVPAAPTARLAVSFPAVPVLFSTVVPVIHNDPLEDECCEI